MLITKEFAMKQCAKTIALGVISALLVSISSPLAVMASADTIAATDHSTNVSSGEVQQALLYTPDVLNQSAEVKGTDDSDSALTVSAATAGAAVDIPKDANDGINLDAAGGPPIDISLPNANQAGDGKQIANGVVAYSSNNGSANAVQAESDGSVCMLTVIDNPKAPTTYDYKITIPGGSHIELTPDGGAIALDANQQIVASVATPWAKDAKGKQIKTWFTVDEVTLTQHVKHDVRGVSYPVVADPKVSLGWKIYVTLSKSETKYLADRPNQSGAYYALPGAAGCFVIGASFLGFVCGGYITVRSAILMDSLARASSMRGCLQVGIPYGVYNPVTFWTSVYTITFTPIKC